MKNPGQFLAFVAFFFLLNFSYGQKVKQLNLPTYDHERLHFGFSLAVNKADFFVVPQKDELKPDTMLSVESFPDWGFNLAIISDLSIHPYATLRFTPALVFQDRVLEYFIFYPSKDTAYATEKRVESTLLDFPLNLKIRSERMNNVSAYLLAGGKFSIDLASQQGVNNPDIVKLTKNDLSYEVGFGIDYYLEYFKFSTEIKFCAGIRDRLVHESTLWSSSIGKLFTRAWIFSINFEG